MTTEILSFVYLLCIVHCLALISLILHVIGISKHIQANQKTVMYSSCHCGVYGRIFKCCDWLFCIFWSGNWLVKVEYYSAAQWTLAVLCPLQCRWRVSRWSNITREDFRWIDPEAVWWHLSRGLQEHSLQTQLQAERRIWLHVAYGDLWWPCVWPHLQHDQCGWIVQYIGKR